jgi:metallo-beta-lactamase family protein
MSLTVTSLGAACNVTGSRHLIEADGVRLLVDCGLYQERDFMARNWEAFPVPPSSIHAVLLTHAHIDHCGFLPRLAKDGFAGTVWATNATAEVAPIVLADTARLQVEEVETKRRRHEREGRNSQFPQRALYDEDDVDRLVRRFATVEFGTATEVAPGIRATWLPAGHIIGAAMILVEVEQAGGAPAKRLLFSGDLGRWDRPLVPDPSDPPFADLVLVESTYGDRLHTAEHDIPGQLERIIGETVRLGGSVLIPSFAVERAQELLWYLDRLHRVGRLPSIPVFLDSPMAVNLLEVYRRHPEALDQETRDVGFHLGTVRCTKSREESKAINDHVGSAIIIAGSGMLNGGRIKHHLAQHLDNPASCLLFVGYQAKGTLGRQLVEGARRVRLFGREREVSLRVEQVQGFSGHADRDEILAWLGRMQPKPGRVGIIHGGESVAPAFARLVAETLGVPAAANRYREPVVVT